MHINVHFACKELKKFGVGKFVNIFGKGEIIMIKLLVSANRLPFKSVIAVCVAGS